ncbi:MAG: hypothetical protein WCH40_02125 [Verrucomicrobiales bacterium]
MSDSSNSVDTGVIIRRSLFFLMLVIMTLGHLFILFRGLNSPQAMDQAQIAREISRGNGFTTKFIRPVAFHQAQKAKGTVPFNAFEDTYHAPLNPLINAAVLKLIGADAPENWSMGENQMVFPMDRIIAAVSTLFFLMAIGVNYLLVSRIFDSKIAGITALLMLFCQTFWGFALSGLPQMLLLLLFSCGTYFTYRAIEAASEGRVSFTPALVAGVFFVLMALTHWLAIWIVFGYIIFAAFAFRPRGIVALSILALLAIAAIPTLIRCSNHSDSFFGTGYLSLYKGLGETQTEDAVMRTDDLGTTPLRLDGIILKVLRTTLLQATDIVPFLGGIVIAPIFFICLFHPFKRPSIAKLRWGILLMWVVAAFGMALFGVTPKDLDSNQLHIVFAPIMTAYGLAFLSILWSRIEFVAANPLMRNVHHVVIVLLCASPMLLDLPYKVRMGLDRRDRGGVPWWPPYYAPALNLGLKNWIKPNQICFSDQPWAVAWYADRMSIWLPTTKSGFEKLDRTANDLGTTPVGILITPSSHGSKDMRSLADEYGELTSLVINGRVFLATYPPGISIYDKDPKIQAIAKKYLYPQPLVGMDMVYYSDRPLRTPDTKASE